MLQNPKSYVSLANNIKFDSPEWHKYAKYGNGALTGKFLDMPEYKTMTESDHELLFVMEQDHFKKSIESDYNSIIDDIITAINSRSDKITASRVGASYKIRLSCPKIETDKDVELLVETLDFILSLIKVVL